MNDKTKKTLKKAGIIAVCVVGGAGLMYAGYLCGELIPIKGGRELIIHPPMKPNDVCRIGFKKPLIPRNKVIVYGLEKEGALELVRRINYYLQEVN